MFPKVPQSSLGILRVTQLPPPLGQAPPLRTLQSTLPETNSKFAPENGWLEDDCYLLGWPIFRCYGVYFPWLLWNIVTIARSMLKYPGQEQTLFPKPYNHNHWNSNKTLGVQRPLIQWSFRKDHYLVGIYNQQFQGRDYYFNGLWHVFDLYTGKTNHNHWSLWKSIVLAKCHQTPAWSPKKKGSLVGESTNK